MRCALAPPTCSQEIGDIDRAIDAATAELLALGRAPLDFGDLRRTTPVSALWGQERGLPLDRRYICQFLERHRDDIRGCVLEVKDAGYTRMFGAEHVLRSDVLDVDAGNPDATVVADLTNASDIPSNTYDCFILTQTLGVDLSTCPPRLPRPIAF